ncbi:hypothetical protein [Brevundimonas sp.]
METKHTVGSWAVWNDIASFGGFRYETAEISRVTPRMVMTKRQSGREAHHDKAAILFSGTLENARSVAERLTSSAALSDQERHASRERHKKRTADIVFRATSTEEQGG